MTAKRISGKPPVRYASLDDLAAAPPLSKWGAIASSAANATERRESLYDELEDTGEGSQGATVAAPAARKAFWGAPRAPMTLALSKDDGLTWPWQRNLEVGDGWCMSNDSEQGRNREYSYPSLRQDADGTLHLAYTVFRQHIRHVRLQPDWATQHP